jgi:hypothetical protein
MGFSSSGWWQKLRCGICRLHCKVGSLWCTCWHLHRRRGRNGMLQFTPPCVQIQWQSHTLILVHGMPWIITHSSIERIIEVDPSQFCKNRMMQCIPCRFLWEAEVWRCEAPPELRECRRLAILQWFLWSVKNADKLGQRTNLSTLPDSPTLTKNVNPSIRQGQYKSSQIQFECWLKLTELLPVRVSVNSHLVYTCKPALHGIVRRWRSL